MQATNYHKQMKALFAEIEERGDRPSLLLHACCAPCASHELTFLPDVFDLTVYYYNPNITEDAEREKRYEELRRLITEMCPTVGLIKGDADADKFLSLAKGLESAPEGGLRCAKCFALRLEETARRAAEEGFDYFATTLTLSPLKNSMLLNEIGAKMGEKYGVRYLASDFKKEGGYQHSLELSRQYDLYRQNYCGCVFSRKLP